MRKQKGQNKIREGKKHDFVSDINKLAGSLLNST